MKDLLPYFSLLIAAIACVISTWTAVRAGKWRNSEEHSRLIGRVGALESWKGLAAQKLQDIEHDLTQLPTSADFEALRGVIQSNEAKLSGQIQTTNAIAARTEAGVKRLEQFLMENRS